MYKDDLALSYLQWFICHKNPAQTNQIINIINITYSSVFLFDIECLETLKKAQQILKMYASRINNTMNQFQRHF